MFLTLLDCSVFCLSLFFTPKIWLITIYYKTKVSFLEYFWQALSNYAFLAAWNHQYLSSRPSTSVLSFSLILIPYSPKKHLNTIYLPTYVSFQGEKCTNHTRIFLSSYQWIIYNGFSQCIIHWYSIYASVLLIYITMNIYIHMYIYMHTHEYTQIYKHSRTHTL